MFATKNLVPAAFRVVVRKQEPSSWAAAHRQQTATGPLAETEHHNPTALAAVRAGIAAVGEINRRHDAYAYPHAA